jgi:hypothetical protein
MGLSEPAAAHFRAPFYFQKIKLNKQAAMESIQKPPVYLPQCSVLLNEFNGHFGYYNLDVYCDLIEKSNPPRSIEDVVGGDNDTGVYKDSRILLIVCRIIKEFLICP